MARLFKVGLHFCFFREVNINGKQFGSWSHLRKELRAEVIRAHTQARSARVAGVDRRAIKTFG
eukprot:1978015-Alexandrium_andersonii.AAC.1